MGVPLQQQSLEGDVGEAVGRLGEEAPVGLQIFDGLAPVWLQVADGVGPVALAPVVEDAKKAVLRSEDGQRHNFAEARGRGPRAEPAQAAARQSGVLRRAHRGRAGSRA